MRSERDRIIDDLEAAETDLSLMEDEMRDLERAGLEDGDEEWENLDREINAKQNEIYYLQACLEDFDYEQEL